MTSTPPCTVVTVSDVNFDVQTLVQENAYIVVQLKSTAFLLYTKIINLGFRVFDADKERFGTNIEIRLYKCPIISGIPQVGDDINTAIVECLRNGRVPVIVEFCGNYYKYNDTMTETLAKLKDYKCTELRFSKNNLLASAENYNNDGIDFKAHHKQTLTELELHKMLSKLHVPVAVVDTCLMGYLPVVRFLNYYEQTKMVDYSKFLHLEPLKLTIAAPKVSGVETDHGLV